ncbi:MAG: UDP-N-acetylglucosamine 2-epimerase [Desulfobacterales bacterium]|jgi:UDP-N-acetylglucosamine 2-epimerase (non-hydrolysing)/GDP/UDP-N,N'-diacetylbacillosamine 2-epimerase (hydrolysing)
MRKIAVVTGTRAEFGLSRTIFEAIQQHPRLSLDVIVTGMHLMEEYGRSADLIERDGFTIAYNTQVVQKGDTGYDMSVALGENIIEIAVALQKIQPDIFLTLTDLGHTLAGAIAAAHMNIPVAHVHGGDVSGSIDESIRHATTKFAHIHFPASPTSAERIRKMGEESWRIFMVGAPGVDEIRKSELVDKKVLFERYGLAPDEEFLLTVQHPVTTEQNVRAQIRETISALKAIGMKCIIIYPNADAGGRAIITEYETHKTNNKFRMYKTVPRIDYLSLLKYTRCLIGNSSSGIIEAPYFKTPVVNIGNRQRNRERASNVINVSHKRDNIVSAVEKALSAEFKASLIDIQSPYGEGYAGERIASVLAEIKINEKLLNKILDYPS